MDPVEREEWLRTLLVALDHQEFFRALSLADQWVTEDPRDTVARSMRAYTLLRLGRSRDALEDARRAMELAPDDPAVLSLFAQAAEAENRFSWAQAAWEQAVQLSGETPELLRRFARFMIQHRGPRLALAAAQQAAQADPENAEGWSLLAAAQFRMHQYQDAEASLKRALALDPNHVEAQALMARFLLLRGKQDQALALSQLLDDSEEARPVADWVRSEVKKRKLEQLLVERSLDLTARRLERSLWTRLGPLWWFSTYLIVLAGAIVLDLLAGTQVFLIGATVVFVVMLVLWAILFH